MPEGEFDKRVYNVLMLGGGFFCVFFSFQTMSNILITLINSIKHETPDYIGDAFYSLAIVYFVLAFFNLLVPPIISVLGTRISMVIGSIGYALYMISFFITNGWAIYVASVILGIGAATIWTAQGTYLTLNSDAYTIARNAALFWVFFQSSTFCGNVFVYFTFLQQDFIPADTRVYIYSVLSGVCLLGVFILMLLRPPLNMRGQQISDTSNAPSKAFISSLAIIGTKDMLLLFISFWFTGTHLAFAASIYSACIGFTTKLTRYPKSLIGLSGIVFAVGEIIAGVCFGVAADITTFQFGRNPIVILGAVVLLVGYVLIYLNLPTDAQFHDTTAISYFDPPIAWLAVLCSFLLGFGDSCFNTQIYSIVATRYRENSPPAFALFKLVQSLGSAVAFLYFRHIALHYLLIILSVMDILAAVTFFPVEVEARTPHFEPEELDIQIPAGPSVNRIMATAPKTE
ncbi:UNC93-like protein MFSD11 [Planococcus citri]|uniref:UNC93-like protein MFSD11 n=1 Tax=Planococcus citri TaxID=170843 RepID=UPI0031F94179